MSNLRQVLQSSKKLKMRATTVWWPAGIARMQANADEEEGSEEDEDFEAGAAEQQEAEDEGDESGSDASGDAEMIDEVSTPLLPLAIRSASGFAV